MTKTYEDYYKNVPTVIRGILKRNFPAPKRIGKVLIKPDFDASAVLDYLLCLATYPRIIETVANFFSVGTNDVVVASAPAPDTRFDEVLRQTELDLPENVPVIDLRKYYFESRRKTGIAFLEKVKLPGDPTGDVGLRCPRDDVRIAGLAVNAELIINLPKLRLGSRIDVSCARRNLCGLLMKKKPLKGYFRIPVKRNRVLVALQKSFWDTPDSSLFKAVEKPSSVFGGKIFTVVDAIIAGMYALGEFHPFAFDKLFWGWDVEKVDEQIAKALEIERT